MTGLELTKKELREQLLIDARRELSYLNAMKILIKGDDDCTAKLHIEGVEHAFSNAKIFLRCIALETKEIKAAIEGFPNTWE